MSAWYSAVVFQRTVGGRSADGRRTPRDASLGAAVARLGAAVRSNPPQLSRTMTVLRTAQ
jgi:hypothetical protein